MRRRLCGYGVVGGVVLRPAKRRPARLLDRHKDRMQAMLHVLTKLPPADVDRWLEAGLRTVARREVAS